MPLLANDTSGAVTRKRISAYVTATEKVTAVSSSDAAVAMTAAEVVDSKIYKQTPTAARAITTPTAAAIVAYVTDYAAGTSGEVTLINLATATHAQTLTANTGVTLVGSATVAAATSGTWIWRIDSATAATFYRK